MEKAEDTLQWNLLSIKQQISSKVSQDNYASISSLPLTPSLENTKQIFEWDPNQEGALINPIQSICYETKGTRPSCMLITFINGMLNSFREALDNMEHLHQFAPDFKIHGVYNHSNSVLDLLELGLNFIDIAPNTAELLATVWTEFHEMNKDNPFAKCLHVCHSQGAIQTRIALQRLPKEIRDRIIIIAIAPGEIVPEALCYSSVNYASERDYIPLLATPFKLACSGILDDDLDRFTLQQNICDEHEQLIILPAAPGAPLWDHPFKSPTYIEKIKKKCNDYIKKKGEYK